MHGMDEPTNKNSTVSPLHPNIPVFTVSDDDDSPAISPPVTVAAKEQTVDVSSGPNTHDKNSRKKRTAKVPAVKNKGKKQKVKVKEIYEKYVMHGKPLKRTQPNEQPFYSSKTHKPSNQVISWLSLKGLSLSTRFKNTTSSFSELFMSVIG